MDENQKSAFSIINGLTGSIYINFIGNENTNNNDELIM